MKFNSSEDSCPTLSGNLQWQNEIKFLTNIPSQFRHIRVPDGGSVSSATDKMNGKGKLRPRPIKSVSQLKPAWPTRPTFHPSNPTIIFELSRHTGTCHLVVRKAKPDLLVMSQWGGKPILHHHAIVKNPMSRLCHGGFYPPLLSVWNGHLLLDPWTVKRVPRYPNPQGKTAMYILPELGLSRVPRPNSFHSTWTPGGWHIRPRSPIKSAQIELPIVGAGLGHVQTSSAFSAKVNRRIGAERRVLCHQRWERSTPHHRQAKPPFLAQLSWVIRFHWWWFILRSYENDTVF